MIKIRSFKDSDRDLICSSFINSTYHNSIDASSKLCNKLNWSIGMNKVINSLITNFGADIACMEDDEDLIIGWSIHKNNMLFYVYVKQSFRNQGISRELIKDLVNNEQTQIVMTSKQMNFITKQLKSWDYNPFL